MEKATFWEIIEKSLSVPEEDQENEIQKRLSEFSLDDIVHFEIIMRELLFEIDDYKTIAVLKIITKYVSDDSYLYFRCWLISKGQKVFNTILQQPDDLAEIVDASTFPDFENLLYVADDAYRLKTGVDEEDENLPRNIALDKGLDYDFAAPPTKGTDFRNEDLPQLYPKLWSIFN